MEDDMKNGDVLLDLKKVIEGEQSNFRGLLKNPLCDEVYSEFVASHIQSLDWVLLQMEKLRFEYMGLSVGFVPINSNMVDLRER